MQQLDLSPLPTIARQELTDFYEFLLKKYADKQTLSSLAEQKARTQPTNFKDFILSIPQCEDFDFERQRDYPRDIEL